MMSGWACCPQQEVVVAAARAILHEEDALSVVLRKDVLRVDLRRQPGLPILFLTDRVMEQDSEQVFVAASEFSPEWMAVDHDWLRPLPSPSRRRLWVEYAVSQSMASLGRLGRMPVHSAGRRRSLRAMSRMLVELSMR